MSTTNSLAIFNSIQSLNELPLNNYNIADWVGEWESYKGRPFEINYKLLEILAEEDPNGMAGKIKEMVDSVEIGSESFQKIDLREIYYKYLENKSESDVDWVAVNESIKKYEDITAIFIDNSEERTKRTAYKDPQIQTIEPTIEKMEGLNLAHQRYFIVQAGGIVMYVKTVVPETYGNNYSLEIRYFSGNFLRKIEIGLNRVQNLNRAMKMDEYAIRTTTAIETVDLSYDNFEREWTEGNTAEVVKKYERKINSARQRILSWKRRIEMSKDESVKSELQEAIDKTNAIIPEAEKQLEDLRAESLALTVAA